MITTWLNIINGPYRQVKAQRQLKWQEFLNRKGIGFRTTVLDIKEKGHPIKDYVRCSISARLRVRGRIVCRHMYTLLRGDIQVKKGDTVIIRYRPGHLSNVLLKC